MFLTTGCSTASNTLFYVPPNKNDCVMKYMLNSVGLKLQLQKVYLKKFMLKRWL